MPLSVRLYKPRRNIHTTGENTSAHFSHRPSRQQHQIRPATQRGHGMVLKLGKCRHHQEDGHPVIFTRLCGSLLTHPLVP